MNHVKLTIAVMVFVLIFLGAGTVSAAPTITVDVEPHEVHVGDIVTLHVRMQNPDAVFYSNILVLFPWPDGLKYEYRHGGGINNIEWSTTSGIWSPGNMRPESQGQQKNLWIIGTVMPELEGQKVKITGKYLQIYDQGVDVASLLDPASPDYLTVLPTNNGNGTGNGTGSGNGNGAGSGNGNGAGNGNGNGNDPTNSLGNSKLTNALSNLTQSEKNDPLANLQTGGGGGKSYEVFNATNQNSQVPENALYAILGILIIVALILLGYFKGYFKMRNN